MFSCVLVLCLFFFKQKTAYEMRISDWSSDVCSSDLVCSLPGRLAAEGVARVLGPVHVALAVVDLDHGDAALDRADVHAEIAADAFGVDHLVALRAVVLVGGNGLVRGVLAGDVAEAALDARSEGHRSELQSIMRIS